MAHWRRAVRCGNADADKRAAAVAHGAYMVEACGLVDGAHFARVGVHRRRRRRRRFQSIAVCGACVGVLPSGSRSDSLIQPVEHYLVGTPQATGTRVLSGTLVFR